MAPKLLDDSSDLDKLKLAMSTLLGKVSSFEDLMDAFGLSSLPTAQRYGVMFGCLTFVCTVAAVLILLLLGGTFQRLQEQAVEPEPVSASKIRSSRPLLLERLLEARERMLKKYQDEKNWTKSNKTMSTTTTTPLTEMLLMVAPSSRTEDVVGGLVDEITHTEDDVMKKKNDTKKTKTSMVELRKYIPPGYEDNYRVAYSKCVEKPFGPTLSGLPEARFEAYARAYAGCGVDASLSYRRSYGRMYELLACSTQGAHEKFRKLFLERPYDLVGRTVRLEALEVDRHLQPLFDITCGQAHMDNKAFDPEEVWSFIEYGPFATPDEMRDSPLFQRKSPREAAFSMVESLTDRVLGVVSLINDDPQNLNIQLEPPIVKPSKEGGIEEMEACFLLMDRLFALGYRRIHLATDTLDTKKKNFPGRLGFTQEGIIPKHMIVKEANRDSNIYGILNSDWDKGARASLFKKLHGAKAQSRDESYNLQEEEYDVQDNFLKEQEALKQAKEAAKKKV